MLSGFDSFVRQHGLSQILEFARVALAAPTSLQSFHTVIVFMFLSFSSPTMLGCQELRLASSKLGIIVADERKSDFYSGIAFALDNLTR